MSIGKILEQVKKGGYKDAVREARANVHGKVKKNKTGIICFMGNFPTEKQ